MPKTICTHHDCSWKLEDASERKIVKIVLEMSYLSILLIEGSLEVKLPTIWTDEKQRWEESEKRRGKKIKKRKSPKKEDPGARKGGKVANQMCFSNDLWLRRIEK